MTDVFSEMEARRGAEARTAQDLFRAISGAVEEFGRGAAFDYKGGECRLMLESGVATMDFVREHEGLVWRLSATEGYRAQVSFAAESSLWPDTNSTQREILAALHAIHEASSTDGIRATSAAELPSLDVQFSPSGVMPEGGAAPSRERSAWVKLDTFLRFKNRKSIELHITSAQEERELGYRRTICISRDNDGNIVVRESLPPRKDAIMGRHFVIPRDRDQPVVFYPNIDDGFTQIIDKGQNKATLESWFRAAREVRRADC